MLKSSSAACPMHNSLPHIGRVCRAMLRLRRSISFDATDNADRVVCAELEWEPVSYCRFYSQGATFEIWSGLYRPVATLSFDGAGDVGLILMRAPAWLGNKAEGTDRMLGPARAHLTSMYRWRSAI